MRSPKTLQKAIIYFADADNCLAYMVAHRWPEGVVCPTCGRKDVSYLANQKKWQCKSGQVRTAIVPSRRKAILQAEVRKHVEAGSALYTDALLSYAGLGSDYAHQVVDHAVEYVNGRVHTNGLENFWSLLKRGINGTYVSIEPFHLFRYLDEQVFRYNNRATKTNPLTDADRFSAVLSQVAGRRVTYAEVTGKVGETIN